MIARKALALTSLVALAPTVPAQSVLHTLRGDAQEVLGYSVGGAGDVNLDGFDDVIVGAPGLGNGRAVVVSGLDGSQLYEFVGRSPDSFFGCSVAGAGDVDQDGVPDLIVGAYKDDFKQLEYAGSAQVFSGADGSVLYTFEGKTNDQLGISVDGAGDVDGDGHDDLVVGEYGKSNGTGAVWVYSGRDGSVLHRFDGVVPGDFLGYSVSGAGDVNGDGHADVIAGSLETGPGQNSRGSPTVFSGRDGSVLHHFTGTADGDRFGWSVSDAGDVDQDGHDDVFVGAPLAGDDDLGSAWVFSGLDGSVLHRFLGDAFGAELGRSVASAGDVDGDGSPDLIVGAPNPFGVERALVYSGADGSLLVTLVGNLPGEFGHSVSGAGDVDGDGLADLIVGARVDPEGGFNAGLARVFSPASLGTSYCGPANPNSTGAPAVILGSGSDVVGDDYLWLHATGLPANQFGYFLNSQAQGFVPFVGGSQGDLCLGGAIGRHAKQAGSSGPAGMLSIRVDPFALPTPSGPHVIAPGETWYFQAWYRDRNPGPTSNLTDGVGILFR